MFSDYLLPLVGESGAPVCDYVRVFIRLVRIYVNDCIGIILKEEERETCFNTVLKVSDI
jgi:hypothetical protein